MATVIRRGQGAMNLYCLLADVVAVLHFLIVAFVLGGMLLILAGVLLALDLDPQFLVLRGSRGDDRRRGRRVVVWHRLPLDQLGGSPARGGRRATSEPGSFLGRLVHSLLFVNVSPAVLCICYVIFGLAVLLVFILAPPRWPRRLRKA